LISLDNAGGKGARAGSKCGKSNLARTSETAMDFLVATGGCRSVKSTSKKLPRSLQRRNMFSTLSIDACFDPLEGLK